MKPFQPNNKQLEAITNGATKLFIPVGETIATILLKSLKKYDGVVEMFVCTNGNPYEDEVQKVSTMIASNSYDTQYLSSFFNSCELLSVDSYSPLQSGESYFVQEEFIEDPSQVIYKANFSKSNQDLEDWQPADQMTEEQSQYKFTVMDVEVKTIQDLSNRGSILWTKGTIAFGIVNETFQEWHDRQYPDHPYSSNPTGFLVTIERIEDER